jgi:cell division protein FtsB
MLPSSARCLDVSAPVAAVTPQTLAQRVDILEQEVENLEILPDRVTALEVQISEFRAEVRAEFSATRTELRQEMRALNEETRAEMRALNDQTRADMHALNDETRTQMRMLHEEILSRFALLDEHLGQKRMPRARAPKTRRG